MPTPRDINAGKNTDSLAPSDRREDSLAPSARTDVSDRPEDNTNESLRRELAELRERLNRSDADKQAAVKAATPATTVEDIEPEEDATPEDTFIVNRETYTENGVQKTKDYRMKTSDFQQISKERGW